MTCHQNPGPDEMKLEKDKSGPSQWKLHDDDESERVNTGEGDSGSES